MTKTLTSFLFCIFSLTSAVSQVQAPTASNNIVFGGADSLNLTLSERGVKVTAQNVVAYFPKDSLSMQQMQKITDTLSYGVTAVGAFVKAPLPWMVHQPTTTYTFYFRPDRFIAHASMEGYLSIPFWRIKNGTAPWMHELVHEMLNAKSGNWAHSGMTDEEAGKQVPLWLVEGIAEYISLETSRQQNWPRYDVQSNSFATNVDSLFLADMNGAKAAYVLSFIGKNGVVPELFSNDRRLYSPAFYHGSASFVKYIAETYGLSPLLSGIADFANEQKAIEEAIGKPLEALKREWLASLQKKKYAAPNRVLPQAGLK